MVHRSESLQNSSKVRRRDRVRTRARPKTEPASRPAGVAEEEGTIRSQIKTKRVTVERVRNERVCDFGHAVRLYVDLRTTGGTERSRERKEKKRKREARWRNGGNKRIAFTQRSFLPLPSRESPSTRLDSNSLVATIGETDRGKETERGQEGKDKKTVREKERYCERVQDGRSRAMRAGRKECVEEAENSLFERPRAAPAYTRFCVCR